MNVGAQNPMAVAQAPSPGCAAAVAASSAGFFGKIGAALNATVREVRKLFDRLSVDPSADEAFGGCAHLVGVVGKYLSREEYFLVRSVALEVLAPGRPNPQIALVEANNARRAVMTFDEEARQAAENEIRKICNGETAALDPKFVEELAKVRRLESLNYILRQALVKPLKMPEAQQRLANDVDRKAAVEAGQKKIEHILAFLATHCPGLERLDLSGIPLLTPEHLSSLSRFSDLHVLSLADSGINDLHVAALKGLPLQECSLEKTPITGSTLHTLHRWIKDLNLRGCTRLTDDGLAGLGKKEGAHSAMHLAKLNVSETHITGSSLHTLHRGIHDLDLEHCTELTNSGVTGLIGMQLARCVVPSHIDRATRQSVFRPEVYVVNSTNHPFYY